jgi:hypothetical protein
MSQLNTAFRDICGSDVSARGAHGRYAILLTRDRLGSNIFDASNLIRGVPVLIGQGDLQEAWEQLIRAIETDPRNLKAYRWLKALWDRSDFRQFQEQYQETYEKHFSYFIDRLRFERNKYQEVIRYIEHTYRNKDDWDSIKEEEFQKMHHVLHSLSNENEQPEDQELQGIKECIRNYQIDNMMRYDKMQYLIEELRPLCEEISCSSEGDARLEIEASLRLIVDQKKEALLMHATLDSLMTYLKQEIIAVCPIRLYTPWACSRGSVICNFFVNFFVTPSDNRCTCISSPRYST